MKYRGLQDTTGFASRAEGEKSMRKAKKITAVIASVILAAGLTACGSASDSAASSSTSSDTASVSDAAASSSAQADNPDATVVEIGLSSTDEPYSYADENNEPAGSTYETLQLIDDYLTDYTFHYNLLDYETILAGTTNGKYDVAADSFFRTDAREEAFNVSDPYDYYFMNLAVKSDSGIESLEDLDGKSIAPIVATDGRVAALTDWIESHPDVNIEFETLASSGTIADEIQQVEDGTYDACYASAEQENAVIEEAGYDDISVTDIVDGRDLVFLINKDETDLQAAFNEAIGALTEDGSLGEVTEKWFGQNNFDKAEEIGLR
jgi:L-cystine transport system substrate-binding protein